MPFFQVQAASLFRSALQRTLRQASQITDLAPLAPPKCPLHLG